MKKKILWWILGGILILVLGYIGYIYYYGLIEDIKWRAPRGHEYESRDYRITLVIYAESGTTEEYIIDSVELLGLNIDEISITTGYKMHEENIPDDAIGFEIKLKNQDPSHFDEKQNELKKDKTFYDVGFWYPLVSH